METKDEDRATRPRDFKILTIQSTAQEIAQVRSAILADTVARNYSESEVFALTLGLAEALANAYLHGNHRAPDKRIVVQYRISEEEAEIRVIDEGDGFDPALVPDPTDAQHIELAHGRGLLLMQSLLDEVNFCRKGTCVRLTKHRRSAEAGGVI